MRIAAAVVAALLSLGTAAPAASLTALFFVTRECPISNQYAPEIRRICDAYAGRGVACRLVYVEPGLTDADARAHAAAYGHAGYPVVVDRDHALVRLAGAQVTPEVAVLSSDGIAYLGRINDFYAALGTPRRMVGDHTLRRALDALLAGRPAPAPRTQAIGCYIAAPDPAAAAAPRVRQ
ncbi:MAG: hypothetical protein AB7P34_05450 [Vicinamibacterales bacterium]